MVQTASGVLKEPGCKNEKAAGRLSGGEYKMRKNLAKYTVFSLTFGLLAAAVSTAAYAVPAGSMGYANCSDAVNIRSAAGPDSQVVGTLYNNDEVYVESVDEYGWALIYANGVEGYVAGQYLSSSPNSNAAGSGAAASYTDTGATSSSSVDALYQAYLDAQEAAMHPTSEAEAQATADAAVAAYNAYVAAANGTPVSSSTGSSSSTSSTASSASVDELYQAYVAAQDAAMHPTSEEEAQSTAAAAVAAYNAYLNAINAADAAAAAGTGTGTSSGSAVSESQVDALYQAYLAAEDAAMHPANEEEAQTTAAAAVEAYNAYLKAVNAYDEAVANGTAVSGESAAVVDDSGTQSTETATQSSGATGSQIAQYATQFVGNPYVYGGSSLTGGADCSGFVMAVFAHFGINLPHNAASQSGYGTPVSMSELQPGDLLFYSNGGGIGHVTIYIGNDQVCHASNSRVGIVISNMSYRTPCAARRLV